MNTILIVIEQIKMTGSSSHGYSFTHNSSKSAATDKFIACCLNVLLNLSIINRRERYKTSILFQATSGHMIHLYNSGIFP